MKGLIKTTRGELAAAFDLWQKEWQSNPEKFTELDESNGYDSADALIEYLAKTKK